MKRNCVELPKRVVEVLTKDHPELARFLSSGRTIPDIKRKTLETIRMELAEHHQVLIRCSSRSNWEPKVVPPRFYDVKLNYPMNNEDILRKALAARGAKAEEAKVLEAVVA